MPSALQVHGRSRVGRTFQLLCSMVAVLRAHTGITEADAQTLTCFGAASFFGAALTSPSRALRMVGL